MSKDGEMMENEANAFALYLLMPDKFISEDFKNGFDLTDDTRIKEVAKKYQVTITMVFARYKLWKQKPFSHE
jgi:Zn-dependent peptidase ImmA (M78 family)